jgi:hypothetical protein
MADQPKRKDCRMTEYKHIKCGNYKRRVRFADVMAEGIALAMCIVCLLGVCLVVAIISQDQWVRFGVL